MLRFFKFFLVGGLFLAYAAPANSSDLALNIKGVDHIEEASVRYFLKQLSQKPFALDPVDLFEKKILGARIVGQFVQGSLNLKQPASCPACSSIKISSGNLFQFSLNEAHAELTGKIRIALVRTRGEKVLFEKSVLANGAEGQVHAVLNPRAGTLQLDRFDIMGAKIGALKIQDPGALQKILDKILPGTNVDQILTALTNRLLNQLKDNAQLKKTIIDTVNQQLIELANTVLNLEQFGISSGIQIADFNTADHQVSVKFALSLSAKGSAKACRAEDIYSDAEYFASPTQTETSFDLLTSQKTDLSAGVSIQTAQNAFEILSKQGVICIEDEAIWRKWGLRFSVRPRAKFDLGKDPANADLFRIRMPASGRVFPHENSRIALSSTLARGDIFFYYRMDTGSSGNQLKLKFKKIGLGPLSGSGYVGAMKVPMEWFRKPILAGILSALKNGRGDIELLNGNEKFLDSLVIQKVDQPVLTVDTLNVSFSVVDLLK